MFLGNVRGVSLEEAVDAAGALRSVFGLMNTSSGSKPRCARQLGSAPSRSRAAPARVDSWRGASSRPVRLVGHGTVRMRRTDPARLRSW
jgi:hypothetical protein